MATLDRDTLEAALIGYEQQKQAIDLKIASIKAQLGVGGHVPSTPAAAPQGKKKGRRKFSAETRAKMAAAQKRRWAARQAA